MVRVQLKKYRKTTVALVLCNATVIFLYLNSAESIGSLDICPSNIIISPIGSNMKVGYYKHEIYRNGLKEVVFSPFKEDGGKYYIINDGYSCKATALIGNSRIWIKMSLKIRKDSVKIYLNYPIDEINQPDVHIFLEESKEKIVSLEEKYGRGKSNVKFIKGRIEILPNETFLLIKRR